MNTLINLIKLNFNSLLSVKKNLMIIAILGTIMTFVQPSMIMLFGSLFLLVSCYSVIHYEERSKMNYLIYSLPITTNQYILSKYIYALINLVIAILLSTSLVFISQKINLNDTINSIPMYAVPLIITSLGIFIVAIVLPCALILDLEKSRFIMIILAVLPVTFSTSLFDIFSKLPKPNITLSIPMMIILGILIAIALLLTSYFITCNIFSKKEVE